MIAAAIVCAAALAQASAFKWNTSTGLVKAGTTETMASGVTAYVFDITGSSLSALFADVKAGDFSKALDSYATDSAGKIAAREVTYDVGTYDFALVAVDGDNFFISNALTSKKVTTMSPVNVPFGLKSQSNSGTIMNAADGYKGNGWYQTVPEPTSGLLLLLGVAGLALKRKRA